MAEILNYLYFEGDDSILIGNFLNYKECDIIGDVVHRTLSEFKELAWYAPNKDLYSDAQLINMLGLVEPKKLNKVYVWTDGSASGKTKLGGIGVYMYTEHNGKKYEVTRSKGYSNTKIGRMEITAIITALELILPEKRATTKVILKSDSEYAVNCVAKGWLERWKLDIGGLANRPNGDLLQKYYTVYKSFPFGNVSISHVKGHAGDPGNEYADELAGNGFSSGIYDQDLP